MYIAHRNGDDYRNLLSILNSINTHELWILATLPRKLYTPPDSKEKVVRNHIDVKDIRTYSYLLKPLFGTLNLKLKAVNKTKKKYYMQKLKNRTRKEVRNYLAEQMQENYIKNDVSSELERINIIVISHCHIAKTRSKHQKKNMDDRCDSTDDKAKKTWERYTWILRNTQKNTMKDQRKETTWGLLRNRKSATETWIVGLYRTKTTCKLTDNQENVIIDKQGKVKAR